MKRWLGLGALAAAVLLLTAPLTASRASGRIDAAHAPRDRHRADSCILGAVVIYTDPYIGGRLSHQEIVADIVQMCARAFAVYAEDRVLDAPAAQRLLRQIIEAGLRGQFHDDGGGAALRDAR
jgi:hypothetical protein